MQDKNKLIEKSLFLLKEANVSNYRIAKDTKITEATIGNYVNGKTKPTLANAEILIRYFTNKGEILKETNSVISNNNIDSSDNYRLVPLINMDAVGGMNSMNEVALTDTEYLLGHIAFNDALDGDVCMPVSGNSMSPTCPSGSIVLVREVFDWTEYFGFGNIFVLLLRDGRRIIKEVTKYDDNSKDYILCVSHNPSVPSEELPKKLISRVWKVIKILVNEGW